MNGYVEGHTNKQDTMVILDNDTDYTIHNNDNEDNNSYSNNEWWFDRYLYNHRTPPCLHLEYCTIFC